MATETLIFQIDATPTVKALQDIGKEIEKNTDALKSYEKGTEAYIVQEATVKVLQKEQRALTNVLVQQKAAIDRVSDATVENIKVGKASENSIDQNRKAYNALYNQLIRTAKPTADQVKITKELSEVLKSQEKALGNTSRNVGNYEDSIKGLLGGLANSVPALKGFQTAQTGVNAAMNANPIGAVIMLLTGLVEIFKSNAVVADQVTFAFEAINKAVGSIIDTVVETVTSFDKLTAALANPVKFLFNLGKNAAVAAKEGYEAAKAMDELTVANARTAAAIKSNDRQVQALTKSLKDKTKSEQERIGIANKIADLEIANSELNKKLAKDYLITEQLKLKGRTKSAENEAKLIELESNLKDAADEADIARAQRQTRINILLEKEKTENVKAENVKRRELRAEELRSIDEIIAKEAEALDKKYGSQTQKELAAIVRREELIAQKIGTPTALIEAETLKRNLLLENDELTATERLNIETEYQNNVLKIQDDAYKKEIQSQQQAAAESEKIQQTRFSVASQFANALSGLVSATGEQSAAAVAFQKILALSQIAINTAQSISAGIAGATTSATATGPGAFVATPIFIASTIATILGAVASATTLLKSAPTPPSPGFATGVIGLDGAGTATSDSIDARLSRGESVITAKATERFAPVLAQMELAVGNRPNFQLGNRKFATGYIPTTDGGYSDRAMSSDVNKANDLAKMFSDTISKMPQPKLVYDEFTKFVDNRNQSVNLSEL